MSYTVLTTSFSFGRGVTSAKRMLEEKGYRILNYSTTDVKALTEEQLVKVISGVHALLCGVDPVTVRVIEAGDALKVIARFGVGYDTVDLNAANRKRIYVTNTPGVLARSVADYAFALLVSCARRIPYTDRLIKRGQWQGIIGTDIHGKTLGIIGLGEIGLEIAKRATGFGMKIIYADVRDVENEFTRAYGVERVDLDTLLRTADFVSVNCNLSPQTRNLLNKDRLDMMKPTAILVNTARGGIVDETHLFEKLGNGTLAGAALDVFEREPPDPVRFKDLDNVIVSSHSAAFSLETINRMGDMAAQNIIAVLEGREPEHWVNRGFGKH